MTDDERLDAIWASREKPVLQPVDAAEAPDRLIDQIEAIVALDGHTSDAHARVALAVQRYRHGFVLVGDALQPIAR